MTILEYITLCGSHTLGHVSWLLYGSAAKHGHEEWECFHGNSTLDMQVDTFLMWYKYIGNDCVALVLKSP